MSDPADLINVAIEPLVEHRFELPAFSTLDRLVGRVRHQVHQHLYDQIAQGLSLADIGRLEALLDVRNGRTDQPDESHTTRRFASTYAAVESSLGLAGYSGDRPLLAGIARTKVQQFAAEAMALDVLDMRRIQRAPGAEPCSFVCCIRLSATRDHLAEMLLRRMRRTRAWPRKNSKNSRTSTVNWKNTCWRSLLKSSMRPSLTLKIMPHWGRACGTF